MITASRAPGASARRTISIDPPRSVAYAMEAPSGAKHGKTLRLALELTCCSTSWPPGGVARRPAARPRRPAPDGKADEDEREHRARHRREAQAAAPARQRDRLDVGGRRHGLERRDEPVAARRHRLDVARLARVVAEATADLRDEAREGALGDERVPPDGALDLRLRDEPPRVGREEQKQLHRLGLQPDGFASPGDPEAFGVDLDVVEAVAHPRARPPGNRRSSSEPHHDSDSARAELRDEPRGELW